MTIDPPPRARRGDHALLRYRYRDASLQAAMPMRVVEESTDHLVAWMSPSTRIMYWALPDGTDPRELPLSQRFHAPLTTAPRSWRGTGVLHVIPVNQPYQVLHFWNDAGEFSGWYINLEACEVRSGNRVDSVDWHLDLWIGADGEPHWKDAEEADAAVAAGHLRATELRQAWDTGHAIVAGLDTWPDPIGDWRGFVAPAEWGPLDLPADWAR